MTDKLKESLSALLDGEASELEVHRLSRQFGEDEHLKGSWSVFQAIRAVVKGENVLTDQQHRDLHSRISEALSSEALPDFDERRSIIHSSFVKPVAGFAAAASLAAVAIFGYQSMQSSVPVSTEVASDNEPAISAQAVSTAGVTGVPGDESAGRELELKELDDEKQRRLRAYLNQHDRMSRMRPDARMVLFEKAPSN